MNQSKFIHVGTFGSPVGIKGEIKLFFLTTDFKFFQNLNEYFDETFSTLYFFKNMRLNKDKLIVHPSICSSRDDAEKLKGKKIFSKSSNFPNLNKHEYYIKDLIGCNVDLENGENIGKVVNVDNFGSCDLIEVRKNYKNIYIPMNNENVVSIKISSKKIVVNPIKGIIN